MKIALAELAELLGGQILKGSPELMICGFASLKQARRGDLSFFNDVRYRDQLAGTQAEALLVTAELDPALLPGDVACITVDEPSRAFEKVVEAYGLQPVAFEPGIHRCAVIEEGVVADLSKIRVGANAVIEAGAQIADGVEVGAGCYVGKNVVIGADSRLFANVTIHEACEIGARVIIHSGTVIGADGFGYEFEQGRHRKIRQAGMVQIDNDVEIGAGTTIDRARFGRTWIGEGTKIDNQVQIGHNVVIGKHCILVSGCGIAGSAVLGDYVVMAAQGGVGGHVTVGSMATLGGRIGVTKDIPDGRKSYLGFPAMEAIEERRRVASVNRLPKLVARVKDLERRLDAQEQAAAALR